MTTGTFQGVKTGYITGTRNPGLSDSRLVLAWDMDGTFISSTMTDRTGNGFDGTVVGGVGTSAGIFNQSRRFYDPNATNLATGYIEKTDNASLRPVKLTIMGWVKINELVGNDQTIVSKWHGVGTSSYTLYLLYASASGGTLTPTFGTHDGSTSQFINSPSSISLREWHHIAGSY